jgi:hypothetical protein
MMTLLLAGLLLVAACAAAGLLLPRLTGWHIWHGKWWMVQWDFSGWFSLGLHIDLRRRTHARTGTKYGPYVDLHLPGVILSFGPGCYWATGFDDINCGRGGVPEVWRP